MWQKSWTWIKLEFICQGISSWPKEYHFFKRRQRQHQGIKRVVGDEIEVVPRKDIVMVFLVSIKICQNRLQMSKMSVSLNYHFHLLPSQSVLILICTYVNFERHLSHVWRRSSMRNWLLKSKKMQNLKSDLMTSSPSTQQTLRL